MKLPNINEQGIAQVIPLIILLVGIVVGTYLVQQQTQFFSDAAERITGAQCETDSQCRVGQVCKSKGCDYSKECKNNQSSAMCILKKRFCGGVCTAPPPAPISKVKYFMFSFAGDKNESLIVKIENPSLVEKATSDMNGDKKLVVGGKIATGSGGYNNNGTKYWSWHLDPKTVTLQESYPQECSDKPSDVENNISEWVGQQFCPIEAKIMLSYDTPPKPQANTSPTTRPRATNSPKASVIPVTIEEGRICIQVITRACSDTDPNQCKDYSSPCAVPEGWSAQ